MDIGAQGQAVAGSAAGVAGTSTLKKALDTQERTVKTLLDKALNPPEKNASPARAPAYRGRHLDVTV